MRHIPHGNRWFDLGSDANWREYGGLWARKTDCGDYDVVRIQPIEWKDSGGYLVEYATIDPAKCSAGDLATCGYSLNPDGSLDVGMGELVSDPIQIELHKLDALIATWGVGSYSGNEYETSNAYRAVRSHGIYP